MDERKKFLIIGISGTTNSGKTTLVAKLNKHIPKAQTMCQDHYYLEPGDERLQPYFDPEVNNVNWEQCDTLDMDRMIEDVEKWKNNCLSNDSDSVPILIIEGFLIFNHSVLTNYFDKKYFLTIDRETCVKRRRHRCYNPPDTPGYFEKVVWPMYLINKQTMEVQTDIVYIDGTEDQDRVGQQMIADIEQLMKFHRP